MKESSARAGRARLAMRVGIAISVALALAACGSSSSSETTDGSSGDQVSASGDDAEYTAMLDKLYKGDYREPNGPVIDTPATGKNIWVIAAGSNSDAIAQGVAGVRDSSKKLGWNVTSFDGKFSPNTQLSGVQQALAAGADGIITVSIDCASIRNGLLQAESAKVPTINIEGGEECTPAAFAYTVKYANFENYTDYLRAYGAAQAEYVIAKTEGQAKVIMNTQTDVGAIREMSAGAYEALEKCPGCEVVGDAKFVGADFGPALQSKISQQLVAHPDANVFIAAYDAALTSGGAQALKSSGRLDRMLVVGGEGSSAGIQLIRDDGGMDACIGYSAPMEGWAATNYLVNIFAGNDPADLHNGVGIQACDKDHNFPPVGESFAPPVDYQAVYERLWSLN